VSTLPAASLFPSWKDEVNRRVAEHKSRRTAPAGVAEAHAEAHSAANGRVAQAAARVAARYANAPSYSQMLAEEARAAMRAAQAAQRAADDAHAVAQMVLAGLEAASSVEADPGLQPLPRRAPELQLTAPSLDLQEPAAARNESAVHPEEDPFAEMCLAPLQPAPRVADPDAGEMADLDLPQPIPANLLQFPREMIATRRMRPRRIEGPLASLDSAPQLSIFEVDPAAVSTQPSVPVVNEPAAPDWMRPEWPAIELDPQPQEVLVAEPAARTAPASAVIGLAPLSRRVLAVLVDGSLTLAALSGVVALAVRAGILLRSPRAFELGALVALFLVSAAYQTLFSSLAKATPGMWYAGIGLCTIDGLIPTGRQYWRRLLALPLSVLPLGLGLAWSLFDEDHLTWHDRLSGTYLRMR
jgi:uncharacterized RDD family membrane protein YckC